MAVLFNYRELFSFAYHTLIKSERPYKLTLKRFAWLSNLFLFLPIWQFFIWIGFGLDEIMYPKYKKIEIKQPIFIIGNPRSGTTFLHRLLAKDKKTFCAIKTWEMFLAPSIVGRKIITKTAQIDRLIGAPFTKLIQRIDKWIQSKEISKIHKQPFWEPEEDDNLLVHIWSSIKIWEISGLLKKSKKFIYFDQKMPSKEKKKIFWYYKTCIKRHIFFHQAQKKHYLSKSPNFTPKIKTLLKNFPDAKIIYLVRNPMEMVPSYINMLNAAWKSLDIEKSVETKNLILQKSKHWYNYPLKQLEKIPQDRFLIIKTEDIAHNPKKVVEKIYKHFNIKMPHSYKKKLAKVAIEYKNYKSPRKYLLKNFGLTKRAIIEKYGGIFKRFKFGSV